VNNKLEMAETLYTGNDSEKCCIPKMLHNHYLKKESPWSCNYNAYSKLRMNLTIEAPFNAIELN
jgi:hypothetical protein